MGEKTSSRVVNYFALLKENGNFIKSQVVNELIGKYKNTYLGFLWHFVNPMIYLILLYIISTELRGRDTEYIIMLASGLFVYNILVNGITGGSGCFTKGAAMIKKIKFPREILVFVHTIVNCIVSLILYAILVLLIVVLNHGFNPVALLWFPVIFVLAALFSTGCALALSSVTVYVRDIAVALASLTIAFFVLSPLRGSLYEFHDLRGQLMWYNPFSYFMEPMHQIFYMKTVPDIGLIGVAAVCAVVAMVVGSIVFHYLNPKFADKL